MKLYDILFKKSKMSWFAFIFEGKLEDIRNKLSGKTLKFFDDVLAISPRLPIKYWKWVADKADANSEYSPDEVYDFLIKFEDLTKRGVGNLPSNDIYSKFYSTINQLAEILQNSEDIISKTQQKKEIKSQTKVIYSDEKYIVIQPTSTASACYYGAGTKWCISAREQNQFENYTNQNVKFVFIIDKEAVKENPMAKVAIAFVEDIDHLRPGESNLVDQYEIYDSKDQWRTIEDIWKNYPKPLLEKINFFFSQNIISTNPEEEKERIQSIEGSKLKNTIIEYLTILDAKILDKEEDHSKEIEYLKYSIEKILNNVSPLQFGRIVLEIFTDRINDKLTNETYQYISNLLKLKIQKEINGMNLSRAIKTLSYDFNIPLSIIMDFDLIKIPDDPQIVFNIIKNSSSLDDSDVQLVLAKNRILLGEFLTDLPNHIAYVSVQNFEKIKQTLDEIKYQYLSKDFFKLPDRIQGLFELTVGKHITIEPSTNDWEDVTEKFFNILQKNELKIVTTKFNKKIVLYMPN